MISVIYSVFCDRRSKKCWSWTAEESTRKQAVACALQAGWKRVREKRRIVWVCPGCHSGTPVWKRPHVNAGTKEEPRP